MKSPRLALVASCLAAFVAPRSPASAVEFGDLAQRLPNDANAVLVVNAAGLYGSALGQREGWRERYADAFEASPLLLPPSAERGVLAAQIDLQTLHPRWEAAVMELSIDPSTADIVRRRGGRTDGLSGMHAAWLGRDTCVLKVAPRQFAVLTPVNRQTAMRWATDIKNSRTGDLSPYLRQAAGFADDAGTHIVLAVDLAHAFSDEALRKAATQMDSLAGVTPDAAATMFASIQGVKLGVKVGEQRVGRVQLDFSQNVASLASAAKPLILKLVAASGAMLPEFADWNPETGPNSLALQGELTPDGMRRLLSLMTVDAGSLDAAAPETATTATASADEARQAMAKASLRYFRGIGKYVEDLDRLQRAASIDQAVMWIENYARKIDKLSTRNVDPELVPYGKYVADTFRSIVDEAWGVAEQIAAGTQPVVSNYKIGYLPTGRTVNYGGDFQRIYAPYGYAEVDEQATGELQARTEDQVVQAVNKARDTLTQLVKDHETVRQKLSAEYGLKF
jgi:hypothetical protein